MTSNDSPRQNLRGRNFRDQSLRGARFTGADLRGARFQKSDLTDADFSDARLGRTIWVALAAVFLGLTVGFLAGMLNIFTGFLLAKIFEELFSQSGTLLIAWTAGSALVIAVIMLFFLYLSGARGLFAASGIVIIVSGTVAGIMAETWTVTIPVVVAVAVAVAVAWAVAWVVAAAVAVAMAVAVAVAVSVVIAMAVAEAWAVAWSIALASAVAGAILFLPAVYTAWRVHRDDSLFYSAVQLRRWFESLGGTNFRDANLTGAQFRRANLEYVRFIGVKTLKRTNFQDAKRLQFADTRSTLLESPEARALLTSGEGAGKSYKGINLSGAFLAGAKLANSDFTDADLNDADLSGADLQGAHLVRTQLIGADLTGTQLTKACIESWNIDKSTILQDIDCEHVYLEVNNLKSRQPPSGQFKPGEFSLLFQQVTETIDFIVESRLELAALLAAIRKLQEEGAEGLEVQGVERRGDAAVVRVAALPDLDRAKIECTLREKELEQKLMEADYRTREFKTEYRMEKEQKGADELDVQRMPTPSGLNRAEIHEYILREKKLEQKLLEANYRAREFEVKYRMEKEHGERRVADVQDMFRTLPLGIHIEQIDASGGTLNLGTLPLRERLLAVAEAQVQDKEELTEQLTRLAEGLEDLKDVSQKQTQLNAALVKAVERAAEDARNHPSLLKDTLAGLESAARVFAHTSPEVYRTITEIASVLGRVLGG
uniref:Pentapeptide repeat-containing protein n=1 Tax=Candidatus Kentrum sp. FW TaxID=2126338 RepID=A0A450RVK8_9GAMM|nr:MAG: Pentapeptide repeat-containing protein [Candidatus Kentron sp. FW]